MPTGHLAMIDYFAPAPTPEEEALRRIKGTYRQEFIKRAIEEDGLGTIPPQWTEHTLGPIFQNALGGQNPARRGGEDLPDLDEGEVEIARLTLVNAVHGEVTSLRARPASDATGILLRVADEYDTEFELPCARIEKPLTAEGVISFLRNSDPSPTDTECEIAFQSFFYPDLDAIGQEAVAR